MQERSFLNANVIPALTAYEYRGHIINAWARPELTNDSTSVGIVYKRSELGSIIQVQRIIGELFESKEQAEQHGLKLCKEWIDKQYEENRPPKMAREFRKAFRIDPKTRFCLQRHSD